MNDPLEFTLRTLDAATGVTDEAQQRRADAVLDRILATPRPAGTASVARPHRHRRRRLAVATAGIAALALAAALVATRGPGDSGLAYASWTPTPSAVAAGELAVVVDACRARFGDDEIPLALAERRGDFVALLFHENDPDLSTSCIARNVPGSSTVEDVKAGSGGSSGPAATPPPGRIFEGAISQYPGTPPASFVDGSVGPGVVGVTIHAGGLTVEATVADRRYAAWWPGTAFRDGPVEPSGEGGPEPAITYDVRLADGRTERHVSPALPR